MSVENRLAMGEAWMWCNECGSKLYSFDGHKDRDIKCPYADACRGWGK